MARSRREAFSDGRLRQDIAVKRSPPVGDGKIFIQSFPRHSSVARFSLDVFQIELRTGKYPSLATYRCYVSKMSWFWQDLHAVYPISPANSHLGIHCVKILPGRPPFSRPRYPNHAKRAYLAILSSQTALMPEPDCPNPSIPGGTVPPTPMALPPGIALPMPHANPAPGRLHRQCRTPTQP